MTRNRRHLKLSFTFNLHDMINNPAESKTRDDTTIDAVFSSYLEKMTTKTYVSYFSYHRSVISVIEYK